MEIYWLGHGCFRLRGRDATLVTNPCAPNTGYKIGKIAADIITISKDKPENNYLQAITGDYKVLEGAGEYDIANVMITAVRTDHGAPTGRNIAYIIDMDDVRICHLGDIAQTPHADDASIFSTAEVLILPVGGGDVLDASKAAETVSMIEPKLVIPMMYKTENSTAELDGVDRFLKELGVEPKPAETRLSITKSNLPNDTTVALLTFRG